jgi:osmotically inducible protein OsmC
MPKRNANAVWEGNLKEGKGRMGLGSETYEGAYSFSSRFEEGEGTNPEELIGAAYAGCFSMALAHALSQAGYSPKRVSTNAEVNLSKVEGGFKITSIELHTQAEVPDIEEKEFLKHAEDAKNNCPVSRVLAGTETKLQANLVK